MISRLLLSHRCYHGGAMHRFEGRYARIPVGNPLPDSADSIVLYTPYEQRISVLEELRGGTRVLYRGDVCVWCGKVVNEQAATREA